VTLRGNYILGNGGNGIHVKGIDSANIGKLDFGHSGSAGGNQLQNLTDPTLWNAAAGICLDTSNTGLTLNAQGNQFGSVNCATTSAALGTVPKNCVNGGTASNIAAVASSVDVTMCTAP
jgi:hypothetical protein